MAISTLEYFKDGADEGDKTPDMIFMVSRPEIAEMKKWDAEQKADLAEWIDDVQKVFNIYIEIIKEGTT